MPERQKECPACRHFVWCESPKQMLCAATGRVCDEYEEEEKTMAEYIEREAAIAYLENHKRVGKEQNFILAANEDAIIKFLKEKCPAADVVEAVRCRDCTKYNGHRYCTYHADPVDDNDFCSYGERKEQK